MSRVLQILFNTDMVRAILDGRKTVKRRINKDANEFTEPDMSFYDENRRTYAVHNFEDLGHTDRLSIAERTCPICPGDILYVREKFCIGKIKCGEEPDGRDAYYVEQDVDGCNYIPYEYCVRHGIGIEGVTWKPSLHMPKEAARIWLRVTNVRVERLQCINEVEIYREGCDVEICTGISICGKECRDCYEKMKKLWNSTIKKSDLNRYGWDANPYVWIIEFERCEKPENI